MSNEKFEKVEFKVGTDDRFRFHKINGKKINLLVPIDYSSAIDTPEIVLEGSIDEAKFAKTLDDLKRTFKEASSYNKETPVTIKLHSFGGKSHSGRGIFDTIRDLSKKNKRSVQIEAFGPVMSAAALVMQAADLGGRKMSENSWMLIHPTQNSYPRDAVNATKYSTTIDELLMQQYSEIVAKRVTQSGRKTTKDDIYMIMTDNNNVGTYMTAEEALRLGLIDEII